VKKNKKKNTTAKKRRFPKIPKGVKLFVLGILLAVAIVIGVLLYQLLRDLPSPRNLSSSSNLDVSTQIYDRNGTLLYEISVMKIERQSN
jgi:membrane carboxypeptidase/penicillin-binding protein